MSKLDDMAEAYWNAFREGFVRVGGDPKQYPTWRQARGINRDAVRNETLRCLRQAVEELRLELGDKFDTVFPEPLAKRSAARTMQDDLMAGKTSGEI